MEIHSLKKALVPLLMAGASFSSAQDGDPFSHKLTVGAYYSKGDYGAARDTELSYVPVAYELSRFPWILSITVPYLALNGPGDVFLEAGNVGRPQTGTNDVISEGGVGDVLLSGTYQFDPLFEDFAFLDFTLQAKLPTADEERDLGTGEIDISAQVDVYKSIGATTWFSTLGYRRRGRTPLYDLRDSAYLSLGMLRRLGERGDLGLLYDYRQKASDNAYETHELMPFYSWAPDRQWTLMVYTIVGFTDSSADETLGLQVSYTWP